MKRPAPPAVPLTDNEETTREHLLALPLFDGCTGEELATLARHMNFAEIGRGERLCSEGEPADTMYFVVSGRLEVLLPDYELPPADIYAIYSHKQNLAAKIRVLVEFLTAHFAEQQSRGLLR